MKTYYKTYLSPTLIITTIIILCAPFINNPPVFDDEYIFQTYFFHEINSQNILTSHRWWVHKTIEASINFFGPSIPWLRIENLIFHATTSVAIFFFTKTILVDLDKDRKYLLNAETSAFLAALFFAIHPISIFSQGYLIQRTIVAATLFSILTWTFFWNGLNGSKYSPWISCIFAFISISAKQHAATIPLVTILLLILYKKSKNNTEPIQTSVYFSILAHFFISIYFLAISREIIGSNYEPMISEVINATDNIDQAAIYPLSILNEASLYFKYIALWILPNSSWFSIDMREHFPSSFSEPYLWLGLLAFISYTLISIKLLNKGGTIGLFGFSLLAPACLFFAEFSVSRFQEPFVLYRSYLWMPMAFISLAMISRRLSKNLAIFLIPIVFLYLIALSYDRLTVLSHPYFIWNEAATLLERSNEGRGAFGAYRIYYNRGTALLNMDKPEDAKTDLILALSLLPDYAPAHHQLGVALLKTKDWEKAKYEFEKSISYQPSNLKSYLGLIKSLDELHETQRAYDMRSLACQLGNPTSCTEVSASR